jgi:hypothetical protein
MFGSAKSLEVGIQSFLNRKHQIGLHQCECGVPAIERPALSLSRVFLGNICIIMWNIPVDRCGFPAIRRQISSLSGVLQETI